MRCAVGLLVVVLSTEFVHDAMAQVPVGPTMCACPGRHKPLGSAPNCEVACFGLRGTVNAPPAGPSPEQLRRQRESKDLREATDDANDRGIDLYKKGDWVGAARYFREALSYSPDDGEVRTNLHRAEQKLREARAMQQLRSVEKHGQAARSAGNNLPGASTEARSGFDTGGKSAANVALPGVVTYGGSGRGSLREPIVPPEKRTPAIAKLEREREVSKKQAQSVEEKIKTYEREKNTVELAKAKQEKSTIESKVQYLNFSIGELLDKPPAMPAQKSK